MKRWWWAAGGTALGLALALALFAPASWLAGTLASATGQRLLLADARGTVWRGSAVLVLTGGPGSRDASALPGRLQWTLAPSGSGGLALALRAQQACCINGELLLRLVPGLGRWRVELPGPGTSASASSGNPSAAIARLGPIGQWPASWLVGLGTPWNTLQPSGWLQFSSSGLVLEQVQGRWLFTGQADLDLANIASRVSTLDTLGNYRLSISGDAARGQATRLQLNTLSGALQLAGSGQWVGVGSAARLRFTGQASAAPGAEGLLGNLLNIIGRRQGPVSVISIG